jgi:hypothetical protein
MTQTNEKRNAVIREVPDAVKHEFWVGKPLFTATVYEGARIFDVAEFVSRAAAGEWLREFYGLTAEEV